MKLQPALPNPPHKRVAEWEAVQEEPYELDAEQADVEE